MLGGLSEAPRLVRGRVGDASAVVRIVLTGGPCAGKSSALAHLREAAKAEGFDVITAPEVATVIFNSGWMFPDEDDPAHEDKKYNFQLNILKLQLQLERSLTSCAGATTQLRRAPTAPPPPMYRSPLATASPPVCHPSPHFPSLAACTSLRDHT